MKSSVTPLPLWAREDCPGFDETFDQDVPSLTPYLLDGERARGALIVCPGGGFFYKEMVKEGELPAKAAGAAGLNAFVLDYRVYPYTHPCPVFDAQRAVRYVRCHAAELGVRPDRIGIMGFSAGGVLAGLTATQPGEGEPESPDPVDRVSARPDAAIVCYAPTDFLGSGMEQLSCIPPERRDDEELLRSYSLVHALGEVAPPLFFWMTARDSLVSSAGGLALAERLSTVPGSELHIYACGDHGMALATEDGSVAAWWNRALAFLARLGFMDP